MVDNTNYRKYGTAQLFSTYFFDNCSNTDVVGSKKWYKLANFVLLLDALLPKPLETRKNSKTVLR